MGAKIDIELAKSWFVLAQLCTMIAGFLIVSLGIILGLAPILIDLPIKLIENFDLIQEAYPNEITNQKMFIEVIIESVEPLFQTILDFSDKIVTLAILFIILAFGTWFKGYKCLEGLKKK